jgi:hypothetical protein
MEPEETFEEKALRQHEQNKTKQREIYYRNQEQRKAYSRARYYKLKEVRKQEEPQTKPEPTEEEIKRNMEVALRNYENQKKANRAYYERKRQAKIEAGTYRPPGRPPKADAEP